MPSTCVLCCVLVTGPGTHPLPEDRLLGSKGREGGRGGGRIGNWEGDHILYVLFSFFIDFVYISKNLCFLFCFLLITYTNWRQHVFLPGVLLPWNVSMASNPPLPKGTAFASSSSCTYVNTFSLTWLWSSNLCYNKMNILVTRDLCL